MVNVISVVSVTMDCFFCELDDKVTLFVSSAIR
jgi:hypothetical protein